MELAAAYQGVFKGGADEQHRQMVLADLAQFSGFYSVAGADADHTQLASFNGSRAVFGRILQHLDMSDYEREALQMASREEAIINQNIGEF